MAHQNKLANENKEDLFIIGIGASAGGLGAYEAFFSAMPKQDLNLAIVLVQHLAPDHKSLLTELIQRCTKMRAYEVKDAMKVEVNCVYIIPPNYDMSLKDGVFNLIKPLKPRGHRMAIDHFFLSLAKNYKNHAIGVILSGTGSDGTKGIQAIKEEGGLVIAQKVSSSEFSQMPQNAINTGLVDFELEPKDMPPRLITYVENFSENNVSEFKKTKDSETYKKILLILSHHTKHDFSMYKESTIKRRIEKRMAINKVDSMGAYYQYLDDSSEEIQALFNDLLIGVTSFFRDIDAFETLENEIIPKLFENRSKHESIRIWVAGCSSGEEAYSVAILVYEYMQKIKQNNPVQIFATDIDERAIIKARAGVYPLDIEENIPKARLEKYFTKNENNKTYQIDKQIRDLLIFSIHDIVKDPPFSKLDMIGCRNVLIYMNTQLQKKVIHLFHYALNPKGILFLGSSESLGKLEELFKPLHQKEKLFQCEKTPHPFPNISKEFSPTIKELTVPELLTSKTKSHIKLPLRDLMEESILKYVCTSCVLVNDEGDILYLHGHAGTYLELPSGESTVNNIFKMAKEGFKKELTLAFYAAKSDKINVHVRDIKLNINSEIVKIDLKIFSIPIESSQYLYIVAFDDSFIPPFQKTVNSHHFVINKSDVSKTESLETLKQELYLQKKFLQDANEKLEKSNEELTAYNEEMQSMNEELQSTNEELETSKEEIQSVNEELSTVNSELQSKVSDLTRLNNDMNNLLAGTSIGMVFVDHQLCILRFTPAISSIINLIEADLGRPLGHIVSNLENYTELIKDTKSVLETLVVKELEVKSADNRWFLMKIQPYRTLENVIEGAVISFVDISEIVKIRSELHDANLISRLGVVVKDSSDAIIVHNLDGNIIAWNSAATRIYGWSEKEALGMNIDHLIPHNLRQNDREKFKLLCDAKVLETYKTQRLHKNGKLKNVYITATSLLNENGEIYAISSTQRGYAKI